jgi:hypothetical protein
VQGKPRLCAICPLLTSSTFTSLFLCGRNALDAAFADTTIKSVFDYRDLIPPPPSNVVVRGKVPGNLQPV